MPAFHIIGTFDLYSRVGTDRQPVKHSLYHVATTTCTMSPLRLVPCRHYDLYHVACTMSLLRPVPCRYYGLYHVATTTCTMSLLRCTMSPLRSLKKLPKWIEATGSHSRGASLNLLKRQVPTNSTREADKSTAANTGTDNPIIHAKVPGSFTPIPAMASEYPEQGLIETSITPPQLASSLSGKSDWTSSWTWPARSLGVRKELISPEVVHPADVISLSRGYITRIIDWTTLRFTFGIDSKARI
ncbi:LOW QUALITY PROTEIN: hypothetical protein ElyMa_006881400 [Elysia marginata]|uniref:Uncharacterized protein n=1 Tax=Elysia marginata TaxID=1093978 RepID=A0AAV4JDI6_9GAST|nr:LOW QUALITY PROTEIN: hypothetical protein ElyMa_006881400 [Elysia marginata]